LVTCGQCGDDAAEKVRAQQHPEVADAAAGDPTPRVRDRCVHRASQSAVLGERSVIFPSTNGTLGDPDNFAGQWRKTRVDLGVPDISSHNFGKDCGNTH
jgi:hypothetical protein